MVYVRTKKELQEAVKRKEDKIVVVGKLAKKIKKIEKLYKLTPAKIALLCAFAVGTGATVIASTASGLALAGPTAGLSFVASIAVDSVAVTAFAVSSGINIAIIICLIFLCAVFGTATIIALLKGYDGKMHIKVFGSEFGYEFSKKGE